ncbi:MAG TPA: AtpZ/AtpI family protein [Ferrovibrio sp.]|uniref:AtpZ/AtpI family protein n=1 Tax=Ferrovibrio sp. TaxID=1917215 RepID=UPI002B4B7907|nr:AtpZ/AtpI family protein [Ferrovibrio sp.]HLT76539.1 AtpZ/AtpI family protein [Ferrovibrio sp.]
MADQQGTPDRGQPERTAGEHAALDSLNAKLDALRDRRAGEQKPEADPRQTRTVGKAWSLAIEMVAAVCVSLFIGWWVDRWLGSAPWGLLGFILLGIATAMWSAIRTGMMMQREQLKGADAEKKED